MAGMLEVEVAYAGPGGQFLVALRLPDGATAALAVARSGVLERCPEIDLAVNKLGVFGRVVSGERVLRAGDRVEIYRALAADPKETRRRLASAGKTMGGRRSGA